MPKINRTFSFKNILILQITVIIYSFSAVAAKRASNLEPLSMEFIRLFILVLALLFTYALLWQQIIKRIDISLAYINKGTAIIWTALWAALFFQESISFQNVIGSLIIIVGIKLVFDDAS